MADGIGRAGQEWLAVMAANEDARIADWFGLVHPIDENGDDLAAWLALIDLGVCAARIVREPRWRINQDKAARDAGLDRHTMHLAPLWRHPITGEETGSWALMLPVGGGDEPSTLSRIGLHAIGDADFASRISDLVAIPVDGGRPLSLSGYTVAIGTFQAQGSKRLTLYGSGMAWLKAFMGRVQALCAETPPHLIEQLHLPFHPPGDDGLLLLEPDAIEWRVCKANCVIPAHVDEIACPDSRGLAEMVDQAMRKKERPRAVPKVLGPKVGAAA